MIYCNEREAPFIETDTFTFETLETWYGGSWVAFVKMRLAMFPDEEVEVSEETRAICFPHVLPDVPVTYRDQPIAY